MIVRVVGVLLVVVFVVSAAIGQTEGPADIPGGVSAIDGSGLHEARRHAVVMTERGHLARNAGQHWTTVFDGRGFTTTPDAGDWTWGLELSSYGWGERPYDVERPRSVAAEGSRLAYGWSDTVTEWYVNDARGLEHGYTLAERPAAAEGPLTMTLKVRGGLEAEVAPNGRDVGFVRADALVLTYSGLVVVDAEGRALPARFEALPVGLRLTVEDAGARYPLTIDPWAQQAYLKASNTDADDYFGLSVALSGDTAVVGAYGEESAATGVNGDPTSNAADRSGAGYVFVRNGAIWSQQAYLKASNTGAVDLFGWSVAVSGDTVVVGAPNEDSVATGVNGDPTSNDAFDSGAAYVFVRNGTAWSQQAYLKASNTEDYDSFGRSVAVSGDTIVVGAYGEDSPATGVNGNQNNSSTTLDSGAAYVFVRIGTTWSQQAYLKASNTDGQDHFGWSVAVSGDTAVVGAHQEASAATGVNGDQTSNAAMFAGAAYVFVRSGTTWSQQAYLKASNTGAIDDFGNDVAISEETVVIGAHLEDSAATGVNGDQTSNAAMFAGAAYVFVRNGTTWSQQAYLKASNTDADDRFGASVAVSGNTVLVGANQEDSAATGANGDPASNAAPGSGAAYVFARNGTTWSQEAYLKASNTDADDRFGVSVAVSGTTVLVGANQEDSAATGVNGDTASNAASSSGAAYVFELHEPTTFCTGKTSSLGCVPFLSSDGLPSVTQPSFHLIANDALPGEAGLLLYSFKKSNLDFHGGKLCIKAPVTRVLPPKAASDTGPPPCTGFLRRDFNKTIQSGSDPLLTPGQAVHAQWRQRDPADPAGFGDSLTDGIGFTIAP